MKQVAGRGELPVGGVPLCRFQGDGFRTIPVLFSVGPDPKGRELRFRHRVGRISACRIVSIFHANWTNWRMKHM